jgi:chromosomal replication initiation ATPase DnaA
MIESESTHALRAMAEQLSVLNTQVSLLAMIVQERLNDTSSAGVLTEIAQTVADHSQMTLGTLRGERRARCYVDARYTAMWLSKELTGYSTVRIGKYFRRDHTTVGYALDQVAGWRDSRDPRFAKVSALRAVLGAKLRAMPEVGQ